MSLFDNSDMKMFLLFIRNFQMTLKASGTPNDWAKILYLRILFHGKALRQLDMLSVEVVGITSEYWKLIILYWGTYFFSDNELEKKRNAP